MAENTSNICSKLIPKLHVLGDHVMEIQEQIKDANFKSIMDATKCVFDACREEKARIEEVLKQQKEVQARLTYLVVENLVGVIVRDEAWDELTISKLKQLIIEHSGGMVVPTGIGDDVLKSMMKKHLQRVVKLKQDAKTNRRKRKRVESGGEPEYLFPILRR